MAKEAADHQRETEKQLHKAVWDSNEVLASASTVMTYRPSTLTLNRVKLVAEKRNRLASTSIMSVAIEDVLNISGSVGPLFGFLNIDTKFTKPSEPYTIGPFRRKDVITMKRVIQGFIIALQKKIDVKNLPTLELRDMLYDLGEDDHAIH